MRTFEHDASMMAARLRAIKTQRTSLRQTFARLRYLLATNECAGPHVCEFFFAFQRGRRPERVCDHYSGGRGLQTAARCVKRTHTGFRSRYSTTGN